MNTFDCSKTPCDCETPCDKHLKEPNFDYGLQMNWKPYKGEKKKIAKCYNCKFASSGFKIAGKTHHQCCHPKHKEGFENGTLSPWDTLQEYYNTCESHEHKT